MATDVTTPLGGGRAAAYWTAIQPWLGRGALATTDQALISGSSFAVSILLARCIGPEQYGVYVLSMSIFLFVAGFHSALILEPMAVFGGAEYRHCLAAYVGQLIRVHLAVTVVLAAVLMGAAAVLSALGNPLAAAALFGMGLAFPCLPLFWLLRRSAYLYAEYVPAVLAAVAFNVILLMSLALAQASGWLSPLLGFAAQCLGALAASAYLWRVIRPEFQYQDEALGIRKLLARHWEYGRWACATNIVHWFSGEVYILLIGLFLRIEDVAGMRALQNITVPYPHFVTAMGLVFLPRVSSAFFDSGSAGVRRIVARLTGIYAAGAFAYLVFLLIFGKGLMEFLYAGKYRSVEYLLPLVGFYLVMTAAGQGLAVGLRGMQAASDVFVAYFGAALVTLVAGVLLTLFWGLPGAVIALVITSMTFLAVLAQRYRAALRKNEVSC